ncbi:MAG TPA: site-specific integrase [Microbacterium sp.]|nr:site-specific integrase [Microbacterium sp.]
MSAAIKAFVDSKRAQGRAELTLGTYASNLSVLLAEYLHRPVRSIATRGAELYAAVLDGNSVDYHRHLLAVGGIWAKWCVKQRWLRADPFADVEPLGQRIYGADKSRLTVDESRRLEAWCLAHPEDQGAILTLGYLYLGTRCSELACRDVRDLDDDGRVLVVGKTKTRAGRRKLAIPESLRELLAAWCTGRSGDAPIFTDATGQRMGRNAARKHVRRVCDAAGVQVLPPQALRRTAADLAHAAGQHPLAIARFLGHSTGAAPKVTEQAYLERGAAAAAQGERVLEALRGETWKSPWKPGQESGDVPDEN